MIRSGSLSAVGRVLLSILVREAKVLTCQTVVPIENFCMEAQTVRNQTSRASCVHHDRIAMGDGIILQVRSRSAFLEEANPGMLAM